MRRPFIEINLINYTHKSLSSFYLLLLQQKKQYFSNTSGMTRRSPPYVANTKPTISILDGILRALKDSRMAKVSDYKVKTAETIPHGPLEYALRSKAIPIVSRMLPKKPSQKSLQLKYYVHQYGIAKIIRTTLVANMLEKERLFELKPTLSDVKCFT